MTDGDIPLRIRRALAEDIDSILQIETEQFSHPWKKSYFTDELTHDISNFFVAEDVEKKRVAGFIIFWIIEETMELHNIAVSGDYKKKGIGKRLMLFLLEKARKNNVEEIFLEVRKSNVTAIRLYEAFHFKQVGVRKDYYSNPVEDAMIFKLSLADMEPL